MSDDQNLHIFYGYVMGCVKATQSTKLSSDRYRIVDKGQGGQIVLLSGFEPAKIVFYRYFLMDVHHHDVCHPYEMFLILVTLL